MSDPHPWRLQVTWSARKRPDGTWEPGFPISGNGLTTQPPHPSQAAITRAMAEQFGRIQPGEPFFILDAPFVFVPPEDEQPVPKGDQP